MNTFKERSNYLKAIALMSIFTFIFLGIEYLFVDMISLLVSENRVVLSQNYVLGMSYLGFILYPLYNRYFKGLSRKICIGNQYHYYWTDYHFLFTSNLSSYTYNRTCLISFFRRVRWYYFFIILE